MQTASRPLIVTARFDAELFARLDQLRKQYFPPERNCIPAHATLFHDLPGNQIDFIRTRLAAVCQTGPLACRLAELKFTGRGMQIVVDCDPLRSVRQSLAELWKPWLTPQDSQPYRPHVTVQNKADPKVAKRSFDELRSSWRPMTGLVVGLDLWHYAGGPWERAGEFGFAVDAWS